MAGAAEETLNLLFNFRRKSDGRYCVKSPGIPGLFLASNDLPALARDLKAAVGDLLHYNRGIVVSGGLHWEPSEEAAFARIRSLTPADQDAAGIIGACTVAIPVVRQEI
jgi:hypothetical protein